MQASNGPSPITGQLRSNIFTLISAHIMRTARQQLALRSRVDVLPVSASLTENLIRAGVNFKFR